MASKNTATYSKDQNCPSYDPNDCPSYDPNNCPSYDPNDFVIERVNEKDYEIYSTFFKNHFLPREQISNGLGLSTDEHIISLREHLKTWLICKASVCVIYVPERKIVGALLTKILTNEDKETFGNEENFSSFSDGVKTMIQILSHIEKTFDVFKDPKVEKVLEYALLAVDADFAGNRLAHRLIEESEKIGLELGCQMATAQAGNFISQRVFRKLDYEECSEVDYESLEIDGKRPLDVSAMNGTKKAVIFRKYLE